jgi:DNA gyrase subunit B
MAKIKQATVAKKSADYTSDDIKQLPFPENVRTRPQIYLSNLDEHGSLTCLREIVNNSVDEFLRGFCTMINVVRVSEREFIVTDNGRGVPFDIHKDSKKNALEVIFGELHSGRNFDSAKTEYTTGLNGVGASCVNAVSSEFVVTSRRDTAEGRIVFAKGIKQDLKVDKDVKPAKGYKSGTSVYFELDDTLFEGYANDEEVIKLLRETAYLNNGLEITYKPDLKASSEIMRWRFEHGTSEFLKEFVDQKDQIVKPIVINGVDKDVKVEISFTWTPNFKDEEMHSFCNTIRTSEHGVHVTGLKRAVSQYFTDYVKTNKLCKEAIENDDVFNGLVAIVSVFVLNPKYATQTKQRLTNNEVNGSVFSVASKGVKDWLDRNGKEMKRLAERFALTARARIASKRALDNVKKESGGFLSSLNSISKFSDCLEDDPSKNELFIVEGSSAAGTVCDGRAKDYQAVYELKGKPLNALGVDDEKIYKNKELSDLISVMRCGIRGAIDIDKCRFDKIIVASDADDDGSHIQLLMLTNYLELFEPLVATGKLYFARPPLYRLTASGKKPIYLKTTTDLDNFFLAEAEKTFEFYLDGKQVTASKAKRKLFHELREYCRELEKQAGKYRIDPHIYELALLNNFDPETYDFGFDKKKISYTVDDDKVSIVGFYRDKDTKEECFLAVVNENAEKFLTGLEEMQVKLAELAGSVEIVRADGKEISTSTLYGKIDLINVMLNKQYNVLRFKGLGEANAQELWETTLDPEHRELVRVTIDNMEEAKEVVNCFMNSNRVDFRKQFMDEVFDNLDREQLSY